MGDRGNIVVRFEMRGNKTADLFLYTHWSGTEIGETAQNALKRRQRWTDDAYLARIVFDELTDGRQGEETGFGIALSPPDNEHDFLILDVPTQRVLRVKENRNERAGSVFGEQVAEWTFEEFARLEKIPEW